MRFLDAHHGHGHTMELFGIAKKGGKREGVQKLHTGTESE